MRYKVRVHAGVSSTLMAAIVSIGDVVSHGFYGPANTMYKMEAELPERMTKTTLRAYLKDRLGRDARIEIDEL